jgi:hypothetical protein
MSDEVKNEGEGKKTKAAKPHKQEHDETSYIVQGKGYKETFKEESKASKKYEELKAASIKRKEPMDIKYSCKTGSKVRLVEQTHITSDYWED